MSKLVWGVGPADALGAIVGEAPGEEEEKQGIPFVGASGKLLDEALEAAGARREYVFITNTYKLRPAGNRTPTQEELNSHDEYLWKELESRPLRAVLVLGNVALQALTGRPGGITKRRGVWECDGWVLPTWHPSYVLRQGGRDSFAGGEFFKDVEEWALAAFNGHYGRREADGGKH